jgi:hypothetical protein
MTDDREAASRRPNWAPSSELAGEAVTNGSLFEVHSHHHALLGINLSFCRVTEGQLDRGYIRMGT